MFVFFINQTSTVQCIYIRSDRVSRKVASTGRIGYFKLNKRMRCFQVILVGLVYGQNSSLLINFGYFWKVVLAIKVFRYHWSNFICFVAKVTWSCKSSACCGTAWCCSQQVLFTFSLLHKSAATSVRCSASSVKWCGLTQVCCKSHPEIWFCVWPKPKIKFRIENRMCCCVCDTGMED